MNENLDLTQLREIAEAAQGVLPEPWIVMESKTMHVVVVERSKRDGSIISGGKVAEAGHLSFRDHIATFDPPTVLALIDRVEAAEAAVQRVRALCMTTAGDPIEPDFDGNTVGDIRRALDGGERPCPECQGTGDVQVRFAHGIQTQDCGVCFGSGDQQ